ncbi:Neuronal acetylcholine receptor subunit alpha-2 [Lamellibrachia satsuma]|nr:Neuronal acetylcholine receptor subunit alpha-2 [Lamellibrachia satsuma]
MMCCIIHIAVLLLSLFDVCIARTANEDGIGFLRKITENTIYESRVRLLKTKKPNECHCVGGKANETGGCACSGKKVLISIGLRRIIELEEHSQTMTVNVWMRQYWNDHTLMWDPARHNGTTHVSLWHDLVWKPDIVLYNNADSELKTMYEEMEIQLKYDGNVSYLYPAVYRITCTIDIAVYPFDQQTCVLKFGSWAFDQSVLDLDTTTAIDPADTSSYLVNSEWQLVSVTAKRQATEYGCCPDVHYIDVTFALTIRRRWLLPFFYLLFPNMLVNIICLMQFFLPCDSSEKITLGITMYLSMIVYLLLIADALPMNDNVPLIVCYMVGTLALVSFSEVVNIIVLQVHHNGTHDNHGQLPGWARSFFLHKVARVLGMSRKITADSEHTSKLTKHESEIRIVKARPMMDAHSANTYATLRTDVPSITIDAPMEIAESTEKMFGNARMHTRRSTIVLPTANAISNEEMLLLRIYKRLEQFRSHLAEEDFSHELRDEWMQLAMVLDRLMFYVYIFGTVGLWTTLYANIPAYHGDVIK